MSSDPSQSSGDLFSAEQVAERLGLHVRTVRAYVRDGRLKAVRIGKQYRIARADLEALTGSPIGPSPRETVARVRHVDVSSVVLIEAIDRPLADRMITGLMGATNGRAGRGPPLRVNTEYDEVRARLKVILSGDAAATAGLLNLIGLYLGDQP